MKNTPTIAELRRSGHKVRVHRRDLNENEAELAVRCAKDSHCPVTEVTVTNPDGKSASGVAYRASGDQFNRKLGNKIALGRALKVLAK